MTSTSSPSPEQNPSTPRSVARKMGIRAGSRAHVVGAPGSAISAISMPPLDVAPELTGLFDYLHLFTTSQEDMEQTFPTLKHHLAAAGMLWVSWPKGRKLDTDLSLPVVVRIGYSHGVVESTCLSVDDTWSALKFTHPKPGKVYRNSHGPLIMS